MSTINDGGPAFPPFHNPDTHPSGATLRDYLAAHATDKDVEYQAEVLRERMRVESGLGVLPDGWRVVARWMHADSMLKARTGEQQ